MTFNKDSSLNFVVRKLYSNFSHQYSNSQSVTNNKSNMFCTSVGLLGENTFQSKFCLKAFNFFTGKFLFSLKKKLKGGDIYEILEVGNRNLYSDRSKIKHIDSLRHHCYTC